MKLFECNGCLESYYKKVDQCPFCDGKTFAELEGTQQEVILIVLREINNESDEYEQFDYDGLKELVDKKLGKDYYWRAFDSALKEACKKGYFTKWTSYISSA
jgi:hypothetical protein